MHGINIKGRREHVQNMHRQPLEEHTDEGQAPGTKGRIDICSDGPDPGFEQAHCGFLFLTLPGRYVIHHPVNDPVGGGCAG